MRDTYTAIFPVDFRTIGIVRMYTLGIEAVKTLVSFPNEELWSSPRFSRLLDILIMAVRVVLFLYIPP